MIRNFGNIQGLKQQVQGLLLGLGTGGSALAGDILLNKTATVDSGQIAGTMVDKGTVTITPSTVNQSIGDGKHTNSIVLGDVDLKASNIINTANIFGIQGSASDVRLTAGEVVLYVDNTSAGNTGTTTTKVGHTITTKYRGNIRLKFAIESDGSHCYGQIYKNGLPIGIHRDTNLAYSYVEYSEDFSCEIGDYFNTYACNLSPDRKSVV